MKSELNHTKKLAHKICAFVLLLTFSLIALATALHSHDTHNFTKHSKTSHFEETLGDDLNNTCHICHYSFNKNNGQVLPTDFYLNFKVSEYTFLLAAKYVASYKSKHLSLFSGNSPPIS